MTWDELAAMEPGLAGLAAEVGRIARGAGRDFCANAAWYGYRDWPGIKPRLVHLVGWSRRGRQRAASGDLFAQLTTMAASSRMEARTAAFAEDIAHGLDALWSDEAYDVAYDHLYDLLPDCRACRCVDAIS